MLIKKKNEVYAVVEDINDGIKQELSKYFSFMIPGYQFMPAYRNKRWDGRIYLYNRKTSEIYYGLLPKLEEFARKKNYFLEYDKSCEGQDEFSLKEANDFIKKLKLPLVPRDYQVEAFAHAIRNKRSLILSVTGSGKTLYHLSYSKVLYKSRKKGFDDLSYQRTHSSNT